MQPRPMADTLGPFEPSNFVFMSDLLFGSVFGSYARHKAGRASSSLTAVSISPTRLSLFSFVT